MEVSANSFSRAVETDCFPDSGGTRFSAEQIHRSQSLIETGFALFRKYRAGPKRSKTIDLSFTRLIINEGHPFRSFPTFRFIRSIAAPNCSNPVA